MDYAILVISLLSLAVNAIVFRRITATYPVGSTEELELTTSHCCCEAVIEHLNSEKKEEAPKPEKKNSEAYSAWTNRTGIPMVPAVKPPEPIVKPPKRAPLARPDGFV